MKRGAAHLRRRGFTLITSLAFVLVVGTVLASVGTVAVSHVSRAKAEATYANAIALADAGINVELARISSNTADPTLADQMGSPRTGSINGVPGSYSVYIRPWGSDCDGSGTWTAPNDLCVVSTGTVDDVSRTVRIRGVRKSIFDEYALFAYKQGDFSGGGASGGSTEIVGSMGTNGAVTFNGTLNTNIVNGTLELDGSGAMSSDQGSNINTNPDAVVMPDVSQVAALQFTTAPTGLSWLAANNDNNKIRMLSSADPAWASEPTIANMTLADVMALPSAGFTTSSRTFADPPNTVPTDTSSLDSATGTRFMTAADATYGITAYGVQNQRIYLVPPGDYYFNNIDFKAGTSGLVFLTHLCTAGHPIRIWIDNPTSGAVKTDNLSVPVVFTDITPSKFRLFYNKCSTLNIAGSSRFNGGFYALNSTCTAKNTPGVDFTGNSMVYGSVITDYFTVSGGTKVVFPNDGSGSDPTDFSLWFGFKDHWKEITSDPQGINPVFVDGTNN